MVGRGHRLGGGRLALALLLALFAASLAGPLATTPASAAGCPNEAIREQQGSAGLLPECRGWELVSPVEKNGDEVMVPQYTSYQALPFRAAEEGAGVLYGIAGATPESGSGSKETQNLGESPAAGSAWSVFPLAPDSRFATLHTGNAHAAGGLVFMAANLSCGVETTRLAQAQQPGDQTPLLAPDETAEEGVENIYAWDAASSSKTLVTSLRPVDPGENLDTPMYTVDGASADCGHVIYENNAAGYGLQGAPEASLYEWTEASGPRVASVLPDGSDAAGLIGTHGGSGIARSNLNEISGDGSRVFFTATSDGGEAKHEVEEHEKIDEGAEEIYMRVNGSETVEISASQTPSPVRDTGAIFEAATKDGSRVFFLASYGLTEDSSTGESFCETSSSNPLEGIGCDLYEYNTETHHLTDLSPDRTDATGASVHGVLGISEDGGHVYFSAIGQLVAGEGASGAQNEAANTASVYAYHEGHISYIAPIEAEEAGASGGPESQLDSISGQHGTQYEVARVSGNGQYLLFATHQMITGYDNTDVNTKEPDPELYEYRYTAGSGAVTCVSCDPTGAPPVFAPAGNPFSPLGPYVEQIFGNIWRNLTDDGRVFFDSYDPLVEAGAEGEPVTQTVHAYEWQPAGVGGCASAAGCVGLLDNGESTFPTYFEDASADGENVYITTPSQLALQDEDGLRDIYDVRVDGGIAESAGPPSCSLEHCQPPGSGVPPFNYSSQSGAGGGNIPNPKPSPPNNGVKGFTAHSVSVKRVVRGRSVSVSVSAPAGGRIAISGKRLKGARKSVAKAGVYRLKVSLTAAGRKRLKRKKHVTVKLHIAFAPSSGPGSSANVTVKFV